MLTPQIPMPENVHSNMVPDDGNNQHFMNSLLREPDLRFKFDTMPSFNILGSNFQVIEL